MTGRSPRYATPCYALAEPWGLNVDFSQATNEQLKAELEGMRVALGVPLGRPFDGREEHKNADLRLKIEAIEAELERRHAIKRGERP
jgi:hypothetical protein